METLFQHSTYQHCDRINALSERIKSKLRVSHVTRTFCSDLHNLGAFVPRKRRGTLKEKALKEFKLNIKHWLEDYRDIVRILEEMEEQVEIELIVGK